MPFLIALAVLVAVIWHYPDNGQLFSGRASLSEMGTPEVRIPERNAPRRVAPAGPAVEARAVVVYDPIARFKIFDKAAAEVRPIASLTKLMSALVFLEHQPDWEERVVVEAADRREGSRPNLFPGDELSVQEIFTLALMASDNDAMTALVRITGWSEAQFVHAMNETARRYRWRSMMFVEPTGLNALNQASALDAARLATVAFSRPEIKAALARPNFRFRNAAGETKTVVSTNRLARTELSDLSLAAGKTGHIEAAGYCFTGWFEHNGRSLITVVLGAATEGGRFEESFGLARWAYSSYTW